MTETENVNDKFEGVGSAYFFVRGQLFIEVTQKCEDGNKKILLKPEDIKCVFDRGDCTEISVPERLYTYISQTSPIFLEESYDTIKALLILCSLVVCSADDVQNKLPSSH